MAKKNTTAQSAAKVNKVAKVAKVAKLDKSAKPAKAAKADKPAKAAKVSGQQAARRGQYVGKRITLTAAGKEANPRGHRGERWAIIKNAKNTDDVLGTTYIGADGEERTITSAKLQNFVERGFIELS